MPSNIGTFRDPISIYYKEGSTISDMGSETLTFTHYDLMADVNQMSGKTAQYYGLDVMVESLKVICRAPILARPVKILYKSSEYAVVDSFVDKRGLFLTMFVTDPKLSTSVES